MSKDLRVKPKDPTHPSETVIHHPEEDQTILARWLFKGMEQGPLFWLAIAGFVVLVLGSVVLINWFGRGDRAGAEAWARLTIVDQDPTLLAGMDESSSLARELQAIADQYGTTRAGEWARYQAASALLNEGSAELVTADRDRAAGKLADATALYQEVLDSTSDEVLRRLATLGLARAEEARLGLSQEDPDRGRLERAVELYERVASEWPDTPEAQVAERLARRLQRPESREFYNALAQYDPIRDAPDAPPTVPGIDLDPGMSTDIGIEGFLRGLTEDPPTFPTDPAPSPFPTPEEDPLGIPALPTPEDETPAESPEPAPDAEAPAVEPEPQPEPAPEPSEGELPDDPFQQRPPDGR